MLDLNSLIKTMPRAYSYIRFSTPEQAKGDSLRRQMEMSAKYAEENGLVLDTSLKLFDQGLSGFNGENLDKGALGLFIRAVETGLVPRGSFLLVESIDRLSRNKLLEQVALFTTLISAGITVITLKDRQVLNREAIDKDNMLLFITMVGMLLSAMRSISLSNTVLPTPRRPVSKILFSGRISFTRPSSTRACSRMPSRPTNSGGGEPAPGENGFLMASITFILISSYF